MKTLVIGGCGFIGSHVVDRLVAEGQTITVLDQRIEAYRAPLDKVAYHRGSWLDRDVLAAVLGAGDFTCVVHLGWSTTPHTSNLDPAADAQSNVVGSVHLLDACVRVGVRRVVFASSGGTVYGPTDRLPILESQPTEPISSYGIAKLAVEKYLRLYQRNHGLISVALRVSNPFGPRQNPQRSQGAVAVFAHRILTRQAIEIWGDGGTVRDYLFVEDVADAFHRAVVGSADGIFNIGSGHGLRLIELVRNLERQAGISAQVTFKAARLVDIPSVVIDNTLARTRLDWHPRTSLEEGLNATLAWLRERFPTGMRGP